MLSPGYFADIPVLDRDPFADGPESLLSAAVVRTTTGGLTTYAGD